ncbi:MAG TPA: DUF6328 family protein [Candidatus Thermoplasmatota archaeon]|nr:DUF6328 family protein [Candidatus Thermoplasmatota archaeon]
MAQQGPPPPEKEGNDIGTRTETFLGEFRMIIPAMAAILGFQLMLAFQQSFGELGKPEQVASFLGLACTASAFLLLLMPASYHRFTWEFEETEEFLRFSRRSIGAAFVVMPFIVALTLYVQGVQVFGTRAAGAAIGTAALLLTLVFWWGIPMMRARREGYLPHPPHHGRRRPARSKGKASRKDEEPARAR